MNFHPDMYVATYELARGGLSDSAIAKSLGVAPKTFCLWTRTKPALGKAAARGRRMRTHGDELTFADYVYEQLSPHLRDVWDEIHRHETEVNGIARMEAMMKQQGMRVRQQLFIFALTSSMFNYSQSLRKLNIPRKTYESWVANDTEFAELMDEIQWHYKNFIEASANYRIAAGDTTMIIHALKTKCRDRGWNDKQEIVHSGEVRHTAEVAISFEDLDLDMDTRRAVLVAMRKRQTALNGMGVEELN